MESEATVAAQAVTAAPPPPPQNANQSESDIRIIVDGRRETGCHRMILLHLRWGKDESEEKL